MRLDPTTGLYDATTGGNLVTTDGAAVARWEDQSGYGRNATQGIANGQPLLRITNENIEFDGSNDFLSIPPWQLPNEFSLSYWVKIKNASHVGMTISMGKALGITSSHFLSYINDGIPTFAMPRSASSRDWAYATAPALSTETWYHIVQTTDRTTNSIYVNTVKGTDGSGINNYYGPTLLDFSIAAYYSSSGILDASPLNGNLGHIAMYDKVLSSQEISDLFNGKRSIYGI